MSKFNFCLFLGLILSGILSAQSIEGIVYDEYNLPLNGAVVKLDGGVQETVTSDDGMYKFDGVSDGEHTITIMHEDFFEETEQTVTVSGEDVSLDMYMQSNETVSLDAVVATGSARPKQKIESSVAVTTLTSEDIQEVAPQSSSDLLKTIPGIYVESSGGEAGNNVFVRGIPADGSFRYVRLQEDGMPLIESPEMMFGNGDNYFRIDPTIKNLEGIRGGSAAIFASNAPGGIINLISNTGSYTKTSGLARFTTSDFGTLRTDFNVGGPLAENWKYNIGGFYRVDDGVRNVGFTANQGGQIKMNLTRKLNNGFIRLYAKHLNDRNHFYLPIPVRLDGDNVESFPGIDANYGTLSTPQLRFLNAPRPGGGFEQQDLAQGINPEVTSIGVELDLNLGNGWKLNEHLRRNVNNTRFNAIFSLNNPVTPGAFVMDRYGLDLSEVTYSYNDNGEAINNLSSLNGNGLIAEVGWWTVGLKTDDVSNKIQLTKSLSDKVDVTFGHFYSQNNQAATWYWHNALVEVADKPRVLNIFDNTNGVSLTDNGYTVYGSNYLNYNFNTTVQAFYVNSDIQATDKFNLDLGLRYELGDIDGYTERTETYDLGDATTAADDNVLYGNGEFDTWNFNYNELAWSIGANYQFNDEHAVFARVSDGFRAPDDNNLVFGNANSAVVEDVFQAEGGYKYFGRNVGIFLSGFYSSFNDLPFSDEIVRNGQVINRTVYAGSETLGVELESRIKFGGFGFNTTLTYQDPKYKDFSGVTDINGDGTLDPTTESFDNNDNLVKRIPKFYALFTPSYELDMGGNGSSVKFMLPVQFIGDRFADPANTNELPAYNVWNASILYKINRSFNVQLTGNNLFNSAGLTEGNPRVDGLTGNADNVKMARPILGRNFMLALTYEF